SSALPRFWPRFGDGTTDQLWPSKCSVRVSVMLGLASGANWPTAHTSRGDAPATAASTLSWPPTFGVSATVQSGEHGTAVWSISSVAAAPSGAIPHDAAPIARAGRATRAVHAISLARFRVIMRILPVTSPH